MKYLSVKSPFFSSLRMTCWQNCCFFYTPEVSSAEQFYDIKYQSIIFSLKNEKKISIIVNNWGSDFEANVSISW